MTRQNYFCISCDDVFLDGYSSEKHLETLLAFCDDMKFKMTFFVVPFNGKGEPISSSPGYVRLLENALAAGHEVGQHGITHDRFEVGIPPKMILDLPHEGPARQHLRDHRAEIDRGHTIPAIREKLRRGREVLENALGVAVKGFRSPALQVCANLFVALVEEGYPYDSSTCLQEAGWDILNGVAYTPRRIDRARFLSMRQHPDLPEMPLTTDYTWYLDDKNFDQCLALAKHDFNACVESGVPFIPVCHVSPIQEGENSRGFEFYSRFMAHVGERAAELKLNLKMATLAEAAKTLEGNF